MNWPTPLLPACFIRRENRFRAIVEMDGRLLAAHVSNSGRLGELCTPGATVWVAPFADQAGRKTACHLALVAYAGVLVSVDALDFLLSDGPDGKRCWLEVKSVTLVEDGRALFPDAPTTRGVRHLEELATLRRSGERVAVGFVVQRSDALRFRPHPTADPAFAAALRRVHAEGVEVYAWRCAVSHSAIELTDSLPLDL